MARGESECNIQRFKWRAACYKRGQQLRALLAVGRSIWPAIPLGTAIRRGRPRQTHQMLGRMFEKVFPTDGPRSASTMMVSNMTRRMSTRYCQRGVRLLSFFSSVSIFLIPLDMQNPAGGQFSSILPDAPKEEMRMHSQIYHIQYHRRSLAVWGP